MTPYRIVLADDHVMLRMGIRKILEETRGLEVAGEAADGLELLDLLKKSQPDMVLLDISMPKIRGIEAAKEIRSLYPDVRILVLSMHRSAEYLQCAIEAGVHGYLLKEDTDRELFSAIEAVRKGMFFVSPLLAQEMNRPGSPGFGESLQASPEPLSCREREVLKLIAEGRSSKEIAQVLHISVRTVHRHRENIMGKLDLRKVADLVKYSIRKGYSSEED